MNLLITIISIIKQLRQTHEESAFFDIIKLWIITISLIYRYKQITNTIKNTPWNIEYYYFKPNSFNQLETVSLWSFSITFLLTGNPSKTVTFLSFK